jgi:hypothetical protein
MQKLASGVTTSLPLPHTCLRLEKKIRATQRGWVVTPSVGKLKLAATVYWTTRGY